MINSYKQITNKYLKTNKKRTILALIGIILSVALISAIGLFFLSMQQAQKQEVKNNIGSFHLVYKDPDDVLVNKIKSNPKITRSGLYSISKEFTIKEDLKAVDIYGNDQAFDLLPTKIKTGRYPQSKDEFAAEKWFIKKIKYDAKLGDKLKIGDKEYTLTGILEDKAANQIAQTGMLLKRDDNINASAFLLVELSTKGNFSTTLQELKSLVKEDKVQENKNLIMYEGKGENLPQGFFVVLSVIISIVVISTIAVIYNSFQISVVERVKQFGLLRAVGATPKQIRRIILKEASFLIIVGIPIGILCGIIALYAIHFAFKLIVTDSMVFISPIVSPIVLLGSSIIGLISVYASALLPAFFAGKISPLVAISSRNSITKEKIKRRNNFLVGKIFGFEGALAAKNIKRNRKRYRTTVFSIIISVILFITFKSLMDMSLNIYGNDPNESKNIHFMVNTNNNKNSIKPATLEKIKAIKDIDKIYIGYQTYWFDTVIDKTKEVKEIKEISDVYSDIKYNSKDMTLLGGAIFPYDDAALEASKSYIKDGNIDINNLNKENGVILVNSSNTIYNKKTKKMFYSSITELKVGDEIYLQSDPSKAEEKIEKPGFGNGNVKKVKILAILDSEPFNSAGTSHAVKMITTKQVAANLLSKDIIPINVKIKLKDVKSEDNVKDTLDRIISEDANLSVVNYIDENRNDKSVILMVQILMYGFVVVVSLIGSVNIINTLTTNIILRRREFGALKSIGLTQKGLKKMIVLEGMLYGIVGGIYGSIIGSGLSYVLYRGLNGVREQQYYIPFTAISIAIGGAILIGYLSVLTPLRRIGKDNLIESLREEA